MVRKNSLVGMFFISVFLRAFYRQLVLVLLRDGKLHYPGKAWSFAHLGKWAK